MPLFRLLCSIVQNHWIVTPPRKSNAEAEAEKYLICVPVPFTEDTYYYTRCIRFSRWYILAAAFLSQFCLGSLYAWSIYNKYIDQFVTSDPAAGKAVIAYYAACGTLGLAAALLGPWVEKVGPRRGIATGAALFLLGHVGAGIAISMKSMVGIYIAYGVVAATGMGLCYSSPIATVQKWFPDLRGTASGFAVCGFGAGPVLWARLFTYPIETLRVELSISFTMFGVIMSVVLFLCAMVMRNPPAGFRVNGKDMHGIYHESFNLLENTSDTYRCTSLKDSNGNPTEPKPLHQPQNGNVILFVPEDLAIPVAEETPHAHEFYRECDLDDAELFYFRRIKQLKLVDCLFSLDFLFLWIMFLFTAVFGMMIISRLYDMDVYIYSADSDNITSEDIKRAVSMVSYNGILIFLGCILWPMTSDVVIRVLNLNPATGRKLIFLLILIVQLLVAILMSSVINSRNHTSFQVLVWTLTFVYGGGWGTIPCFLCDMFGAYNIGALNGVILTCGTIAGVGGGVEFTYILDTAIKNHSFLEAYDKAMPFFGIGVCIGVFSLLLIRTNPVDRFAPGYQFSIGRFQLCNFKPKGWQFRDY